MSITLAELRQRIKRIEVLEERVLYLEEKKEINREWNSVEEHRLQEAKEYLRLEENFLLETPTEEF